MPLHESRSLCIRFCFSPVNHCNNNTHYFYDKRETKSLHLLPNGRGKEDYFGVTAHSYCFCFQFGFNLKHAEKPKY